ncbi:MAG: hypothetical protein P1U56_24715 [Saprospiraceae bacterium]|nr:hypothetical protein [Saprospiraceae bacterium]
MKKVVVIAILILGSCTIWAQGWRNETFSSQDDSPKNVYEIQRQMDDFYQNNDRGKGSGYKQYKRWFIENESKFYPSGQIFNFAKVNQNEYASVLKSHLPEMNRWTHGNWESMGPYDFTQGFGKTGGLGRVNCVGFHPWNDNIIYIGTPSGGLWRTLNGGNSWHSLTDGLPSIGVSSIIVQPSNPNIIYILTGDGDAGETPSIGVLKSFDAGATWQQTDLIWDESTYVRGYKMVMNPSDENELVVVGSKGIWRTYNGGQSFTQLYTGYFTDIEYHPTDHDTIYAAHISGIYRATNGPEIFTKLSDPNIDPLIFEENYHRIAIAVTEDNPDYLYALYGGGVTGFEGMFKSTDAGETFSLESNSPNILGGKVDGGDSSHQAFFDLAFEINPNDGSELFVGGVNIWKSEDSAVNWEIKAHWVNINNSIGYTHADIHNINYRDSDIFVCSDGGIFKSINNGEDWINLTNNLPITMIYDFDIYNGVIVCGTQDNGSMKWNISDPDLDALMTYGGDGFECMIDPSNPNTIYQCSQGNRARSWDGGNTWCDITPPILGCTFDDNDDGGQWDASWVLHPTGYDTMYAATKNLYRSFDQGTSWENVNVPLPAQGDTFLIRAMVQSTQSKNNMFVSDRFKLYWTSNLNSNPASNVTWQDISQGLPTDQAQIGGLAMEPGWNSHLWVTFLGYESGEKVYYTSNWGDTWSNISGNLPNVPIRCITHEQNAIDGIYVGTDIGVFYKNNNMTDWQYFSNGLPNVPINDMKIDNGYLYVGTWGRGMWRTPLYTQCPNENLLTIANDPSNIYHTGSQVYHANTAIVSERIITGGLGTNVQYNAGNYVRMDPGFHAKALSTFQAKIEGCPE